MNIRNVKQLGARITNGTRTKNPLTVDGAAIRELAHLIAETGLTEIEIESGGQKLRVAKQPAGVVHALNDGSYLPVLSDPARTGSGSNDPPTTRRETVSGSPVSSPMVGTVYVAPEPGKPPFVKVGDTVKEGDTLLIVEAMKTMNPIVAPKAGTVREICVSDSEPVEFGQTLMVLS
jgi:acetyl-CoA carboxylase biotin carboxyl carrier protein